MIYSLDCPMCGASLVLSLFGCAAVAMRIMGTVFRYSLLLLMHSEFNPVDAGELITTHVIQVCLVTGFAKTAS